MSRLDDELAKDENLWRMWCEDGVTETTALAVDVFFYATDEFASQQIAHALRCWGLSNVEVRVKRTALVFKGWDITGVEQGTWSLQKLQDRSKRYVRLAEIWSALYEGCGAMMPSDGIAQQDAPRAEINPGHENRADCS
jgi:hypothetical protein